MSASYGLSSATAVILAGGRGTRLRSVLPDRPKVLAPVCGRPFLAHLLGQLGAAGLRRVVLCTGHLGDQVHAEFGDSFDGIRLVYSRETLPAGTGGALRLARDQVRSSTVLVLNGDSFCGVDFFDLWEWHHVHPAHVTVATTAVRDARSFGRVETDTEHHVLRFAEKATIEGPGLVNAGIYLLHTALLGRIPDGRAVSLETELLPRWVEAGGVYAYPTTAALFDIGTPERLRTADVSLRFHARGPDHAPWLAATSGEAS